MRPSQLTILQGTFLIILDYLVHYFDYLVHKPLLKVNKAELFSYQNFPEQKIWTAASNHSHKKQKKNLMTKFKLNVCKTVASTNLLIYIVRKWILKYLLKCVRVKNYIFIQVAIFFKKTPREQADNISFPEICAI